MKIQGDFGIIEIFQVNYRVRLIIAFCFNSLKLKKYH